MSPPIDPGHFFQTETSISESSRKANKAQNTSGDPIRLPSKILAVIADPHDPGNRVYVAESAGVIRRTGDFKTHVYRGPSSNAPITCLTFVGGGDDPEKKNNNNNSSFIVGGCWDKRIWVWDTEDRVVKRTLQGHDDFVKALLYHRHAGKELLISGGADGNIIIWGIEDDGWSKLAVLKDHQYNMRGVLDLSIDPVASSPTKLCLVSASSDPEIRCWSISIIHQKQKKDDDDDDDENSRCRWSVESSTTTTTTISTTHETSVNRIRFDEDGDLWTASSDRTTRCLARHEGWNPNVELAHPDFVRDVVVDEIGGKIITACRDEEVRVWDRGTGNLVHTFSGHFEEVTGLVLLNNGGAGGTGGRMLVSVSIDGTIRRWSLRLEDVERDRVVEKKKGAEEEEMGMERERKKGNDRAVMMTEEERRELEELLDDDED